MRNKAALSIWWRVALLVLAIFGLLTGEVRAGEFETANQSYDNAKYAEAKEGYEKLAESGQGSANLFYNLGNTDLRLGSAGRAILDYERALALNPRHPEAKANLKLLRDRSNAKLLALSWGDEIAVNLPPDVWSIVASVAGWIFFFGLVWIFTHRRSENLGLWSMSLIAAVICAAAVVSLWNIWRDQNRAVVTAAQTEARLAPAESAGVAEALPAGSQVRVISERGPWIYCELPSAGRGWIPEDAVERVRPEKS